jgi:hypothetical protein
MALNPDISYADIAAVVALFFTAFTFTFSMWQWNRKRKSEQIEIARNLMVSIKIKYRKAIETLKGTNISEISNSLNDFVNDVDYFRFLIKKRELVYKNVVNYHGFDILTEVTNVLTELTKSNLGHEFTNREAYIRLLIRNGDFFKKYGKIWDK